MENKPLTVLGIDLEGINQDLVFSGINLEVDRVMEIGAVHWDWELKQPVKIFSELINESDRLPINQELQELTGISEEMLERYAHPHEDIKKVLDQLGEMMENADYMMAHNGTNYDEPMLRALFERHQALFPQKVWIDSLTDIEYPPRIKGKSLAMLEYSHGFLNPFPHRAVTDVLSMLKVASGYGLARMAKLAASPKAKIVAKLNAPNWRNKEEVDAFNKTKNKVSKSGFKWNPENKTWFKFVPQVHLDEGSVDFDFDWYMSD